MTTRNSSARAEVIEMLKEDHKRVKKAFRDFSKLDPENDPQACQQLADQICTDLQLHARLEEEVFYPAARSGMDEPELIEEAEVEHASAKWLIEQLRTMSPDNPRFAATVTVLGEYVKHHIKEEEGDIFEKLSRSRIEWEALLEEMHERRTELMVEMGLAAPAEEAANDEADSGEEAESFDGAHAQGGSRSGRGESSHKAAR
ncbi:hemerythrin domain-containing protein [Eleftheria terrae]|uniref:hemerythrin domain-containing protein n=1 Tax=Eleftheria terrae TaxID=1597781 RepID=UPI00263AA2E1|nr:hemerythrin domain-containing protein [Eleftheria terrae]WKB54247.1 hemerythrin domain-containing protein [Eleftheria terrae]